MGVRVGVFFVFFPKKKKDKNVSISKNTDLK